MLQTAFAYAIMCLQEDIRDKIFICDTKSPVAATTGLFLAFVLVAALVSIQPLAKDVVVTTYRESAPEGIAARAFYKHLGFAEGKLTEEFGSPVQEFVLKR